MLSINIERIGANNKLILTMTTIIIHRERGGEKERERERERGNNNQFETLSLRTGLETIR